MRLPRPSLVLICQWRGRLILKAAGCDWKNHTTHETVHLLRSCRLARIRDVADYFPYLSLVVRIFRAIFLEIDKAWI